MHGGGVGWVPPLTTPPGGAVVQLRWRPRNSTSPRPPAVPEFKQQLEAVRSGTTSGGSGRTRRKQSAAIGRGAGWTTLTGNSLKFPDDYATCSLNHLIRPQQQRGWNLQTERLGGLHVDDQLEFGG
jgi:hypothetical protein